MKLLVGFITHKMKYSVILFSFLSLSSFAQALDDNDNDPCLERTHGLVIHFIKSTDTIFETECDSISHIANYILTDDTTNYYLIGIACDTSSKEKSKARHRSELLKSELIHLGVEADRLEVILSLHIKPEKGKPRDWPFYPIHYKYEIGVFLETNYE